mmetsp:Transcript_53847/g.166862  ORF Transcript_53847/g.166862 Transcript_53847/m.166862 type:complete len:293 (+) Transcript_53847:3-881(+)
MPGWARSPRTSPLGDPARPPEPEDLVACVLALFHDEVADDLLGHGGLGAHSPPLLRERPELPLHGQLPVLVRARSAVAELEHSLAEIVVHAGAVLHRADPAAVKVPLLLLDVFALGDADRKALDAAVAVDDTLAQQRQDNVGGVRLCRRIGRYVHELIPRLRWWWRATPATPASPPACRCRRGGGGRRTGGRRRRRRRRRRPRRLLLRELGQPSRQWLLAVLGRERRRGVHPLRLRRRHRLAAKNLRDCLQRCPPYARPRVPQPIRQRLLGVGGRQRGALLQGLGPHQRGPV